MENGDQTLILRCERCNKPFDREASLKRHGYYCRSRRGEKRLALPRSCVSCARAKVRCNRLAPKCSKCAAKNIDCRYPSNSSSCRESKTQQNRLENDAPTVLTEASSCLEHDTLVIPQCTEGLCTEGPRTEVLGPEIANNATNNLAPPDSAGETFALDFSNIGPVDCSTDCLLFNDAQIMPATDLDASSTSTRLGGTSLQSSVTEVQLMIYANANARIPQSLGFNQRAMWTRPKPKIGSQVIANQIARILSSYPKMMKNYGALPPFIHPQWISSTGSETFLEPLANCMSLLGILGDGPRGNASLFWRNVRMECDRLSSTRDMLSKHGTLAAVQALLVYLLIRLAEGETQHNNHDAALLGTLTLMLDEMRKKLQCMALKFQSLELVHHEDSWSNWIFEESRRRMALVFRIINMLVCVEPVTFCSMHPGLLLAPLPARKQLWEAGSEEQWLDEVQKTTAINNVFGLAVNGDVVTMDEYKMKLLSRQPVEPWTSSRSTENWEAWCAGMDEFGGLILMTASLSI